MRSIHSVWKLIADDSLFTQHQTGVCVVKGICDSVSGIRAYAHIAQFLVKHSNDCVRGVPSLSQGGLA